MMGTVVNASAADDANTTAHAARSAKNFMVAQKLVEISIDISMDELVDESTIRHTGDYPER
jgi:hypothetical protein